MTEPRHSEPPPDQEEHGTDYLRQLLRVSPAVIYAAVAEHPYRALYVTENLRTHFGHAPADFVADPRFWIDRVHPDDLPALEATLARPDEAWPRVLRYRFRHADGTYRWVRDEATLLVEEHALPQLVGYWIDISDTVRAEDELRDSEQRYRNLVEASPLAILLLRNGRLLYANAAAVRLFDAPDVATLLAQPLAALEHPEDRAGDTARLEQLAITEAPISDDLRVLTLTGRPVEIEASGSHCVYRGEPAVQVTLRNVTARKEAERERCRIEDELRRGREYLQRIVSVAPVVIFSADVLKPHAMRFVSPNVRRVLGYGPEQFLSSATFWADNVHPDDAGRLAHVEEAIARAEPFSCEYRFRHADGTYRWIRCFATVIGDAARPGAEVVGYWLDVTDRKQAEEALAEREQYFRRLIENASDVITVIGTDGTVRYESPASRRVTGFAPDDIVGRDAFELIHPDDVQRVRALFEQGLRAGGSDISVEFRHRHRDGSWRVLEATGTGLVSNGIITGAVINSRDVTDRHRAEAARRELEDQLRQAQKMEAVGRLAGGVAHDFNNMLTAILGYSDVLLDQVPKIHPYRPDLEEIRRAGEKAAALTRQLLAFSRRQVLQPEVLDPNTVIKEMMRILQRTIGEDVHLRTALQPAAGHVRVDRGQLEQVIVNLAVNARDAMPLGGSLVISTTRVHLPQGVSHGAWTVPAGDYALIRVEDSGSGMSADVLAHVFEPFFTTKTPGRGTGLGLPMVFGIIAQSGGHIAIESEEGRGTRVLVYLPAVPSAERHAAPVPEEGPEVAGSETVLLVEDETVIRMLARRALTAHGYNVLSAADGAEAEAIATAHDGPIHLLLTDVVMPGMSGVELASRLRPLHPDMRCLFTSGYTDESLLRHGLEGGTAFLQKPFTPSTLRAMVRRTLEDSEANDVPEHTRRAFDSGAGQGPTRTP